MLRGNRNNEYVRAHFILFSLRSLIAYHKYINKQNGRHHMLLEVFEFNISWRRSKSYVHCDQMVEG